MSVVILTIVFFILLVAGCGIFKHKENLFLYDGTGTVDFWLKRLDTPENVKVVMNIEEINKFNLNIIKNNSDYMINFNNFDDYYSGTLLKDKILKNKYIHNLPNIDYLNINSIKLDNENNDKNIKVSYAVVINRANLRIIPTNFKIFSSDDKFFHFDNLQQKELKYGEGVIILHYTTDKKWVYVKSNNAEGWVENKFLAKTNKNNFLDYINMNNFLVVVSKNMIIDNKFLDMGVKIKLGNEDNLHYNVIMPERDKSGNLIFIEKIVKKSNSLNKGFLSYTRLNVAKQSFKYINEDYGWGGLNNSVDCSGLVNNVYSTFGFLMPRNSKQQQMLAGKSISLENKNNFKRNKILDKTPTGSLLYMNGHIMIYLGKFGKKYFVIHSVGSYYKNKNMINMMKVNIMDIDYRRKNGKTFKESLLSITNMERMKNGKTFKESPLSIIERMFFIKAGTILFSVSNDDSEFSQAVSSSAISIDEIAIDHVALLIEKNKVIEATPENGVAIVEFKEFLNKSKVVFAVNIKNKTVEKNALKISKHFLGKGYNHTFEPDNTTIYCSQLITESFLYSDGSRYFLLNPMNFLNEYGDFIPYWVSYYKQYNKKIPQGVMGSHPKQLFIRKNLFRKIKRIK